MARVAEILVKIRGDAGSIGRELDQVQSQLDGVFGSKLQTLMKGAAGVFAAGAAALSAFGAASIKAAADMEQTRTAFTNMLGSAQEAKAFIEDLQDFAAKTPFEFDQVKGAAQKFLAFGFTAQQVIPTLTAVGNAASALGMGQDGIDRLTLAMGQMAAKGKVSGEEMRQLAEAGIPAWQLLADKIGVSIPEAMDRVSKGAVNAQVGLEALIDGMNEKFAGMMDEQSKTLVGLWSTLKDNVNQTMIEIGTSLVEALNLKPILEKVGDFLSEFRELVQKEGIAEALKKVIPPELMVAIGALTGALAGLALGGFSLLAVTIEGTLAAIAPFVAIAGAIGAALVLLWRHVESIRKVFVEVGKTFTSFGELGESLRRLFASLTNAGKKIWTAFRPVAKFFGTVLVGAIALVGVTLVAFLATVAKFVSVVVDAFTFIVDFVSDAFARVGRVIDWAGDKFMDFADGVLPGWAKNALHSLMSFIEPALRWLDRLATKIVDVGSALSGVKKEYGGGYDSRPVEEMIALQERLKKTTEKTSYSQFGGGGMAESAHRGGGGGGQGKDEHKALLQAAQQTSKSIEDEWFKTFATKSELIDRWYQEELAELEKSRQANENYERDKVRLTELYGQKRIEALQAEAIRAQEITTKVRDMALSLQENTVNKKATGSQSLFANMALEQEKAANAIRDRWQKLSNDYITMTQAEQTAFKKMLDERGISYEVDGENRISFAKASSDEMLALEEVYQQQRLDIIRNCKDIEADINAAQNSLNFEQLQEALSAENVARLEDLELRKQAMAEYQQSVMDAEFSMSEVLADLRKKGLGEFQNSLSGLLQGTLTLQQAFVNLGKVALKAISDYIAQTITAMIRRSILGRQLQAQELAMTKAAALASAVAWNPAAVAASIATQGAAAYQGQAAYTMAMSSIRVPMMATGGIVSAPTVAMVGEGKYPEAVLPLSEETFDQLGEGIARNGGGGSVVLNVSTMDAQSFEGFLQSTGGKVLRQLFSDWGREFVAETGVW